MVTIWRMVEIVTSLEINNCEREKCMKFAVNNKTNTKYFPLWVPFSHGGNGNVEELWVICKDSFCISYRENCELDIIFTEMTDGEVLSGRDLAVSFEFQELLAAVATENREDPLAEMLTQYIKLDFPENGISKEMDTAEIARRKQLFVEWFDQMTEQLSEGTCRYFFEGMNEPFGGKEVLTASQQFQTTRFLNGTDTVFNGICRQNEDGGMRFASLSELMESQCQETELIENPDGNTLLKNLEIFCDYYTENHTHYIGVGKKRYGRRENVSVCRYIGKGIPIVKIPPMYSGALVSRIDEDAFRECDIEEIYIPEGVEIIGNHAFEDCLNLKRIHLPMGIKQLDIETIPFDCVLVTENVCDFLKEVCYSDRNIHNIGYELEDGTIVDEDMNTQETDSMEELPAVEEKGEFSQNLSALSEEISDLLVEVEQALDKSEKNEKEEISETEEISIIEEGVSEMEIELPVEEEVTPEVKETPIIEEGVSELETELPVKETIIPEVEEIDTIANKLAELEAILEARNLSNQEGEEKISIQIPEEKKVDFVIPDIMPELLYDESEKIAEEVNSEIIEETPEELIPDELIPEKALEDEVLEEELPSMEEMLASLEDEPTVDGIIAVDEPTVDEIIAVDEPTTDEIVAKDEPMIEEVTEESIAARLEILSKEILEESIIEEQLTEDPMIEELKIIESPIPEEVPELNETIIPEEEIEEEPVEEVVPEEEPELDEIVISEEEVKEELVEEMTPEEEPELDEIVVPEEESEEVEEEKAIEEIATDESEVGEIVVSEEESVEEVATKVSPLRITIGEKGNSFIALNMPVEMLQMIGICVEEETTYPIMLLGNYIDCAIEDHIIKYNFLTKEMTRKTVDENVVALLNSSVSRIAKLNDSYRMAGPEFTMIMNAALTGDFEVLNERLAAMRSFLKFVEEDGSAKVKDDAGEIHSMQEVLWMISQNV